MKRFVLLRHDHPHLHWDFLLEAEDDSALCPTWRWQGIPDPGQTCPALRLPDHRAFYLDYEGPVSGGRGEVLRVWAGYYEVIHRDPTCWLLRLFRPDQEERLELRHLQGDDWFVYRFDAVTRPSDVSP